MTTVDPLFSLKHNFYVGNHSVAITMAESYLAKHASSPHTLFAKAYRARAMIAMGNASSFLKEVKADTEEAPELMELCALLARTYAPQASASSILATMEAHHQEQLKVLAAYDEQRRDSGRAHVPAATVAAVAPQRATARRRLPVSLLCVVLVRADRLHRNQRRGGPPSGA